MQIDFSNLVGGDVFHAQSAVILARLSELVYKDQGKIKQALSENKVRVEFFGFDAAEHDTEAVLIQKDKVAVLVFRGTEKDRHDIVTDLKFRKQDLGSGGKAHRGFVDALECVRQDVLEVLCALPPDTKLFITGHSLGGALAVLAATIGTVPHYFKPTVYTFGAPKVGDETFKNMVDSGCHHYDVINCADVVPRVPFYAMGFKRSGQRVYIDKLGQVRVGCGFWSALIDRWTSLESPIRCHRIGEYVHKLVQSLEAPEDDALNIIGQMMELAAEREKINGQQPAPTMKAEMNFDIDELIKAKFEELEPYLKNV